MPHIKYLNANGERLPSVTTILRLWGEKDGMIAAANKLGKDGKSHRDEWRKLATLGSRVHEVCSLTLEGTSIDDAVEQIAPNVHEDALDMFANCIAGWSQCRSEVKWGKPLAVERNMVSEKFQFGGCPDVCVTMGEPAILDFKTGNTYPEHVAQVAAYRQLWNENINDTKNRARCGYLVKLNRDTGGYEMKFIPETTLDGAWQFFRYVQVASEHYKLLKKAV